MMRMRKKRTNPFNGWTENVACVRFAAVDADGRICHSGDERAVRWCAKGWVDSRMKPKLSREFIGWLALRLDKMNTYIAAMNDSGLAGRDYLRALGREWAGKERS